MPIERGRTWGDHGPLPDDGVLVRSDEEARAAVEAARRAGAPLPVVGLLGGDLCRTLGGNGDESRIRSEHAARLPVDLGEVLLDGRLHWFVAHLVARPAWWRGRAWAVMNAQWLGDWNVAPRAHPGDGVLDILDARLPPGQRLLVRSRLPTGTHLPHPGIRTARRPATQVQLEAPTPVYLDGVRVGRFRTISVRVEADALTVVV